MHKKILSFITAVILIITIFIPVLPAAAWVQYTSPSSVSGSDYTDNPAFAKALDDLFAGDIDLYSDSARKKEVSMPLGFRVSMSKQYYMYSTSRKTQTYGWTCYIYSNGAFNKLFGEYVHNGNSLKNCYIAVGKGASKMTYDLLKNANIRPGAYIRTSPKSDGSYYGSDGHSMIILGYDSKYITYLEGNGDGKGLVRVTKRTYAEFNSAQLTGRGRKITHIVQPTEKWFNELYGNRPENNTYTFSYDGNGGNINKNEFTVDFGNEFTLSSSYSDRDAHYLAGWQIKRDSDDKWYTKSGWYSEKELAEYDLQAATINNGEILVLNLDFIADAMGDTSYTAYAVWNNSTYETCTGVNMVSSIATRQDYPIGSTVSFADSKIEFTFESGNTVRVKVNTSCSDTVPQVFRFNGYNYSFYIDSTVEQAGKNNVYVRLDSYKGCLTSLNGTKTVESTLLITDPKSIAGENATLQINYSDGTTETVTTTQFIPVNNNNGTISGFMKTDAGFSINWDFTVSLDDSFYCVTYCGTKALPLTKGDINLDGQLNSSDLASMKLILMKVTVDFYEMYCTADFNDDGEITTADLALIKLSLVN